MITIGTIRLPTEALIWIGALVGLALFGTNLHGHLSFCIPTLLGLNGCIGCGLGHSIALTLHGDWEGAFRAHLMGIPAVGILLFRSISMIRQSNNNSQGFLHG
ncbi:MAG: DUF2752 domain-containing protein [Ignavibacteria bacterium]|nr:DUF2752 domain-containing protein [Ignavibacteria bacterium]